MTGIDAYLVRREILLDQARKLCMLVMLLGEWREEKLKMKDEEGREWRRM